MCAARKQHEAKLCNWHNTYTQQQCKYALMYLFSQSCSSQLSDNMQMLAMVNVTPHLANGGAHPGAVVVKALNTVVINRAVVRAWRLKEVTRVIITHCNTVAVHHDITRPAGCSGSTAAQLSKTARDRLESTSTCLPACLPALSCCCCCCCCCCQCCFDA
jgi:hypothetical protein